jgi:hypothetical protein
MGDRTQRASMVVSSSASMLVNGQRASVRGGRALALGRPGAGNGKAQSAALVRAVGADPDPAREGPGRRGMGVIIE